MNLFFRDIKTASIISWNRLIRDLKSYDRFNPFCRHDDFYDLFRHIIFSMLSGKDIVLLDGDFSPEELSNLTGYSAHDHFNQPVDKKGLPEFNNKTQLISILKATASKWRITLFTSGTTGIPKKFTHDFASITRFVKYRKEDDSIWGFAYNPSHMAGIQVFLQALLNGNPIVRLFGYSSSEIRAEIKSQKITHISATPTFYRLILPCVEVFPLVRRITSGGEKFNENLARQLSAVFPNARITNVYALTEAGTLLASENDLFTVKQGYESLIKAENGELLVHKSFMGESVINFDQWYHTGDLIDVISNKPLKFRFLNRKSEMINVGGYKVNPSEVEEIMLTMKGIKDVRVFSRSNSVLGNIICCEVVLTGKPVREADIRKYLQSKIQEFKIPRIFWYVDKVSTTRSGKIKRNKT